MTRAIRTTSATVVAVTGAVVVVAYAGLLAVNALVLDPLASVPGRSLAEIYTHVDAMGNFTTGDVHGVLVTAGIGACLGIAAAVVGLVARLPATVIAVLHLGVLAAGALATFQSMFFLPMDIADSYPLAGSVLTTWTGVLYLTSLAALVAIPALFVTTMVATPRRTGRGLTRPA